jgi:hypothetical protein
MAALLINSNVASKNLIVKSAIFPYRNYHKFIWTCADGKGRNQIGTDTRRHSSVLDVRCFRTAGSDHCLLVEKVRDRQAVTAPSEFLFLPPLLFCCSS